MSHTSKQAGVNKSSVQQILNGMRLLFEPLLCGHVEQKTAARWCFGAICGGVRVLMNSAVAGCWRRGRTPGTLERYTEATD